MKAELKKRAKGMTKCDGVGVAWGAPVA